MDRSILPEVSVTTASVPGKTGTSFQKVDLNELQISVRMRLKASVGDDLAELRHMLAERLYAAIPEMLVLDDEPTRYYLATTSGSSDMDRISPSASVELTFLCPDPIAYGQSRTSPMTTSANIKVGGTWPTKPTITAKPAAGSYYKITNYTTGEFVQINRTFNGTETVVIDCEHEQANVNGVNAAVTIASDYFAMSPGAIRLTANNGTATVEWIERWL